MTEPRSLVDTSVHLRDRQPAVAARLEELLLNGRLWTCRIIDLEIVRAANAGAVPDVALSRRSLPEAPITPATMDRALDVMEQLATNGTHMGVSPLDCVIAACAERARLALVHYDGDFDLIAGVTGQRVEWVAPAVTLDGQLSNN